MSEKVIAAMLEEYGADDYHAINVEVGEETVRKVKGAPHIDFNSLTPAEQHLAVLKKPLESLACLNSEFRTQDTSLPLVYSPSRGNMPVLTSDRDFKEANPLFVVANAGGQLMNSPHFPLRREVKESGEIVAGLNETAGPPMLAYTLPGDTFIYSGRGDQGNHRLFKTIVDSFASVGIGLTREWVNVNSLDDWISENPGKPILPNILDPELVSQYGNSARGIEQLRKQALIGVCLYNKEATEKAWSLAGIPTPKTGYFDVSPASLFWVEEQIKSIFGEEEQYVVNTLDGSGGFNLHFLPPEFLETHLTTTFLGQRIQVQRELKAKCSPCLIANITDQGILPLIVSRQRFSQPGVHSGNIWHSDLLEDLERDHPDFLGTNQQALEVLKNWGTVGQVNVDSIVTSDPGNQTLMREANIRPAGSSVLLRLRQGNIDGSPITRIHTSTKVALSPEKFKEPRIVSEINRHTTPGRTRVVLYNYSKTGTAAMAFLGHDVSEEEMLELEQATKEGLLSD